MNPSTTSLRRGDRNSISEQLIEVCSAPVDAATRDRAAVHLLDWLGCILAGGTSDAGMGVRNTLRAEPLSSGNCFVCGEAEVSASAAAFVNGGLGNILEMDDVHRASLLHAGDVIIPATLAMAQQQNATLVQLLDGIVRGYELALRLGVVAAAGGYSNWYNSGTCGIFGAALGSGSILGLDRHQLKDCLGQAGMLGSGIWQCRLEPTWSKQLASANAARNGVMAAFLGQQRFGGARFIFEGEAGFYATYYPQADVSQINLEPVENWLLHDVSFKPWPACRHNHPAIEAALQLHAQVAADVIDETIDAIEIETYQAAIDFCDNRDPVSAHEARFSLQHCVAVALCRGEPGIADFNAASRADVQLTGMRNKTRLITNESYDKRFPRHMGSTVTLSLRDGRRLNVPVDNACGDPENPMSLEDIQKKFRQLARGAGVSESTTEACTLAISIDKHVSDPVSGDKPNASYSCLLYTSPSPRDS